MVSAVRKCFKTDLGVLILLILLISLIFGLINPVYFSAPNMLNIVRSGMENSVMAVGVLLVIISGGIDISFMAIGSFSMYVTVKLFVDTNYNAPIILIYGMAACIGLLLGFCNAFFISKMSLPAFIVTLGTQSVIKGSLILFFGTKFLVDIPQNIIDLSKNSVVTATSSDGSISGVSIVILIIVALYILISFMLKYTRIGRNIYAIGGEPVAAKRAGINITGTLLFVYGLSGSISGLGGIIHCTLFRKAVPGADMIGNELFVIAAVILGGARLGEGKGTVIGTILGVLLITIISNNLTLLKVPAYWQQAVLGLIIILSTSLQLRKRGSEITI